MATSHLGPPRSPLRYRRGCGRRRPGCAGCIARKALPTPCCRFRSTKRSVERTANPQYGMPHTVIGMSADSMPVLPETESSPERWTIQDADEERYKIGATLNPRVVLESIRISRCLLNEAIDNSSNSSNSDKPALKLKFVLAHDEDEKTDERSEDGNIKEKLKRKAEDDEDTDIVEDSDSSGELTIVQDEIGDDGEEGQSRTEWSKSDADRKKADKNTPRRIRKRRNSQNQKDTHDSPAARHLNAKRRRLERELQRKRAEEISRAMENEAVAKRIAMEFSNIRRFRVSSSNDVAKSECTSSTEARSTQLVGQPTTSLDKNASGSISKSDSSSGTPPGSVPLDLPLRDQEPVSSASLSACRDVLSSSPIMPPSKMSNPSPACKKPGLTLSSHNYPLPQFPHHHIPVSACPAPRPAPLLKSASHRSPLLEDDLPNVKELHSSLPSSLPSIVEESLSAGGDTGSTVSAPDPIRSQLCSPPTIHIPSPLLPVETPQGSIEGATRNPSSNSPTSSILETTSTPSRSPHTARPPSPAGMPISIRTMTNSTTVSPTPERTGPIVEGNLRGPLSPASQPSQISSDDQRQVLDRSSTEPRSAASAARGPQFNPKLSVFSVDNLTRSDSKEKSPSMLRVPKLPGNCRSSTDLISPSTTHSGSQPGSPAGYQMTPTTEQPASESNQQTTRKTSPSRTNSPREDARSPARDIDPLPSQSTPMEMLDRSSISGGLGLIPPRVSGAPLWSDAAHFCLTASSNSKVRVVRQDDFQFAKPSTRKVRSSGATNPAGEALAAAGIGQTSPGPRASSSSLPLVRPSIVAPGAVDGPSPRAILALPRPSYPTLCPPTRLSKALQESKSAIIWKYIEAQSATNYMQTIDSAIESVRTHLVGLDGELPPSSSAGAAPTSGPSCSPRDSTTILGCYLQGQLQDQAATKADVISVSRSAPTAPGTGSSDVPVKGTSLVGAAASNAGAPPLERTIAESSAGVTRDPRAYNLHQLKRVLVTIQRFSTTISIETGKTVYHNIYALASGSSTIEEFVVRVQRATKLTMRPNVARFISAHLPHLQKEISVQAASFKMSSSRYMRSNPECLIDPNLEPGDPQGVFLTEFEPSSSFPYKRRAYAQSPASSRPQANHPVQNSQQNVAQPTAMVQTTVASSSTASPLLAGSAHERGSPSRGRSPPESAGQGRTSPPMSATTGGLLEGQSKDSEPLIDPLSHPYIDIQNNLLLVQEMLDRVSKIVQSTKKQIIEVQQLEQRQLRQHLVQQQRPRFGASPAAAADGVPAPSKGVLPTKQPAPSADGRIAQDSPLQRGASASDPQDTPCGRDPATASAKATTSPSAPRADRPNHHGIAMEPLKSIELQAATRPGDPKHCWNCGRSAEETCSGCKLAKYCGAFCQHRDWEVHHRICPVIAANKPSMATLAAALS